MLGDAGFGVAHAATALTVQSVLSTARDRGAPRARAAVHHRRDAGAVRIAPGVLDRHPRVPAHGRDRHRVVRRRPAAAAPLGRAVTWVRVQAAARNAATTTGSPIRLLEGRDRIRARDRAAMGSWRWARRWRAGCSSTASSLLTLLRPVRRPEPRAGAARVRGRVGARVVAVHAGGSRLRRGRAGGHARARPASRPATRWWRRSSTGCSRSGCRSRSGGIARRTCSAAPPAPARPPVQRWRSPLIQLYR